MRKGEPYKAMPPHGTIERFRSRVDPCRCADCKRAWSTYMREYRARRRHS